jgi:hypothetical protein
LKRETDINVSALVEKSIDSLDPIDREQLLIKMKTLRSKG